ncbi:neural-cadherin-like isoform X2 [Paramacrobiotus metropolitanus]|uniref:neural-cadherin-like isoform X2 n=1 Tax=Paramacrobiotus metropolitanus TaxID=2943436 RepID=UPI00244645CB|nr:neural-cadherin-like isoform X2 [Paramacrobiotus metropolitanus]
MSPSRRQLPEPFSYSAVNTQRVTITVQDDNDTPPHFINAPRPFQAVVPINAPENFPVFRLEAIDPDANAQIRYKLTRDQADGKFTVDEVTGDIRTTAAGKHDIIQDREYVIYVRAEDRNGINQNTEDERVSIVGGRRPPQFYEQQYTVNVPENKPPKSSIISVRARSFADKQISYSLDNDDSNMFKINPTSGDITLEKPLDYDDPRQPKTYLLTLLAKESGGMSTAVRLTVNVKDVNDNAPKFGLPIYQGWVDEDISTEAEILTVTANDPDEGDNGFIDYSINDPNFKIRKAGNSGVIYAAKRLDADRVKQYEVIVTATDRGSPARSSTSTVRIFTFNTNDEVPTFSQMVYTASLEENAQPSAVVATVYATDIDGDKVSYGFVGTGAAVGQFVIDKDTGVIQLWNQPVKLDLDKYELNVTATDDGSCCKAQNGLRHTSTALVIVSVTDVNDNKPVFTNCSDYERKRPTVMEEKSQGTYVTTVHAVDQDSGMNGKITYEIEKDFQQAQRFDIDPETGVITTRGRFDRESNRYVSVTVIAKDGGMRPLIGICSFQVELLDENDNPPVFERTQYETTVRQDRKRGPVIAVIATDADAGRNSEIEYSLDANDQLTQRLFGVDKDTGWIYLKDSLPASPRQYEMTAVASDKGERSLSGRVPVMIRVTDVSSRPPKWVQVPKSISINETVQRNHICATIKATSEIPTNKRIFYELLNGNTLDRNRDQHFLLKRRKDDAGDDIADLVVYKPLDFETTPRFNLTLQAKNDLDPQLDETINIVVDLIDQNDEIPLFERSPVLTVLEDEPPLTIVGQVRAKDSDGDARFRSITYSIDQDSSNGDWRFFEIDPKEGIIRTKTSFDREHKSKFTVSVVASDGFPSAIPGVVGPNTNKIYVRIEIGDKNDNVPFFEQPLYEASVQESAPVGHTIMQVVAKDKDELNNLRYQITRGNVAGVFAVQPSTGVVFLNGELDYETLRDYNLVLVVSDGAHQNETRLHVVVQDVNDIAPVFTSKKYTTQIMEEDASGLPKELQFNPKIEATDGDTARNDPIRYSLVGQGVGEVFVIPDDRYAKILITKPLDRDPPKGDPVWTFTILAKDEDGKGLTGYADVEVRLLDINDNDPVFPSVKTVGAVKENSPVGTRVMTMSALDYDDPNADRNAIVRYDILRNVMGDNGQPIFEIDAESGVVKTAWAGLDRERVASYQIVVRATDGGGRTGTGTATIDLQDENDSPPKFQRKQYSQSIDETPGSILPNNAVLDVGVNDADITNNFVYDIVKPCAKDEYGCEHFYINSNSDGSGSLFVLAPLDFENDQHRAGFRFRIFVNDRGDLTKPKDTAQVQITLNDINDNPPKFDKPNQRVERREDIRVGEELATFKATDADNDGKSQVSYRIKRSTDPGRQFTIGPEGIVRVQQPLDREKVETHYVEILAVDDGTPKLTSTATLTVHLLDVNDNPPQFAEDYNPVVFENEPPDQLVAEVSAMDPDSGTNHGGPFTFSFPHPNNNPAHNFFRLEPKNSGGANGNGSAMIYTTQTFDREDRKYYYVPIIIEDVGGMSGTSTLTVTIGDRNDNEMFPGSKEIFVYNYMDKINNVEIGRVHVEDKDDWDLPDKQFTWAMGTEPSPYFDLNRDTGMITMKRGATEGQYRFSVDVLDKKYEKSVTSTVVVNVMSVTEEAVAKSGSIRLRGISAEDFIQIGPDGSSKYDKFKELVKKLTGAKVVEIFSVISPDRTKPPYTDVRYSAHGSPLYSPVLLDGVLELNREDVENTLGVKIDMVPITFCNDDICEEGCTTLHSVPLDDVATLINANKTSLLAVTIKHERQCVCKATDFRKPESCATLQCYNGGVCRDDWEPHPYCECPDGFDGPRCQRTMRNFKENSFAWFPTLEQCQDSHLSFEFMTEIPEGLLVYNGPIGTKNGAKTDFLAVDLSKGRPRVHLDLGFGTPLKLEVATRRPISDGSWHRLDIYWSGQSARIVVDWCRDSNITDPEETSGTPSNDLSACEARGQTLGFQTGLNVHQPLQLGGLYGVSSSSTPFSQRSFEGCMRNVIYNGNMYDMQSSGHAKESAPGCEPSDRMCGGGPNEISRKCINGQCIGTYYDYHCECYPGFRGEQCNFRTKEKSFEKRSFMRLELAFDINEYSSSLQLMFRTRKAFGQIFAATSISGGEYLILEIRNHTLHFRYDLNPNKNEEYILTLGDFPVDDGRWHTVRVNRYGADAVMTIDGGDGRRYGELISPTPASHRKMKLQKEATLGARVQERGMSEFEVVFDFEGCMNDVRYDGESLPMDHNEQSNRARILTAVNVTDNCESKDPCKGFICPDPMICVDLWRLASCQCPPGFKKSDDASDRSNCVDVNECEEDPGICRNGGTCQNFIKTDKTDRSPGYACMCQPGYVGQNCNAAMKEQRLGMSYGAIIAMVISAVVLLSFFVCIIFYTRRRRAYDEKMALTIDPDDDIRENIVSYHDEGAGEEDMQAYDITPLRIPIGPGVLPHPGKDDPSRKAILPPEGLRPGQVPGARPIVAGDGGMPDLPTLLQQRLQEADNDPMAPPYDELRLYAYEGGNDTPVDLSDIEDRDEEEGDYDYLKSWGPRFEKLAKLYAETAEDDENL